jgi:hypothetical protein
MKMRYVLGSAVMLGLSGCLFATPALAATEETQSSGVMAALQSAGTANTLAAAFLVLYGGISLFSPRKLWEMGRGRREKTKRDPTAAELNAERIAGAIFIFLGIMLFLGMIR